MWCDTDTVTPSRDCWYESMQQCVSEKCLEPEVLQKIVQKIING
jgi:hypothetical protein